MFVTGRGIESVMPCDNPVIPDPDYIICDVGATVLNGQTLEPVQPIQSEIESRWPGTLVIQQRMRKIKGLRLQPVSQQRRCSFFYDEHTDIETVKKIADEMELDVLLSAGRFLDILPKNINKGSTLKQLVKLMHFSSEDILVAGDTLNDRSLYDTQYKGVVVGEAEQALIAYTNGMPNVLQAKSQGAGGILESLKHFPEFRGYISNGAPDEAQGDTQLLVMYHRFPYEMKEIDGAEKKVSPKSPNGIIPSLLGFFSNGRTGAWIVEEVRNKNKAQTDRYIDEGKYPNLIASRSLYQKRN